MKELKSYAIALMSVFAVLVLLLSSAILVASSKEEKSGFSLMPEFEDTSFKNPDFNAGYGISVIDSIAVTLDGMSRDVLVFDQGANVKLFIASDARCDFVIEGHKISEELFAGKIYELEFKARYKGKYDISCFTPTGKPIGSVAMMKVI